MVDLYRGEERWYLRTVEQTLSLGFFFLFSLFFFFFPSLLFRPEQINGSLIQLEPGFSQLPHDRNYSIFFPLTLFGLHIAASLAFVLCLEWP